MSKVVRRAVSIDAAERLYAQWLDLREHAKRLTDRRDELRDRLKDSIQEHGQPDEKGSMWLELVDGRRLKAQRSEKSMLDGDRAMALLLEKGAWDDCHTVVVSVTLRGLGAEAAIESIQKRAGLGENLVDIEAELVVDEDAILALASDYKQLISDDELDSLYDRDITWSFIAPDK